MFSSKLWSPTASAALTVLTAWLAFAGSVEAAPAEAPPVALTSCLACHGAQGAGSAALGAPRLAGQNAAYLIHALSGFREGQRVGATMQTVAHGLSDSDIAALAAYFSQQSAPLLSDGPAPAAALVAAGGQLAERGSADIAACFSCHGAGGKGNGNRYPAIAGQPANYVVTRLRQFQERAKTAQKDPATMSLLAAKMSDAQIAEAAAYLSQLAP